MAETACVVQPEKIDVEPVSVKNEVTEYDDHYCSCSE